MVPGKIYYCDINNSLYIFAVNTKDILEHFHLWLIAFKTQMYLQMSQKNNAIITNHSLPGMMEVFVMMLLMYIMTWVTLAHLFLGLVKWVHSFYWIIYIVALDIWLYHNSYMQMKGSYLSWDLVFLFIDSNFNKRFFKNYSTLEHSYDYLFPNDRSIKLKSSMTKHPNKSMCRLWK